MGLCQQPHSADLGPGSSSRLAAVAWATIVRPVARARRRLLLRAHRQLPASLWAHLDTSLRHTWTPLSTRPNLPGTRCPRRIPSASPYPWSQPLPLPVALAPARPHTCPLHHHPRLSHTLQRRWWLCLHHCQSRRQRRCQRYRQRGRQPQRQRRYQPQRQRRRQPQRQRRRLPQRQRRRLPQRQRRRLPQRQRRRQPQRQRLRLPQRQRRCLPQRQRHCQPQQQRCRACRPPAWGLRRWCFRVRLPPRWGRPRRWRCRRVRRVRRAGQWHPAARTHPSSVVTKDQLA